MITIESATQEKPGKFKMIYLDPPFYTQTDFGEFTDKWESLQDYRDFIRRCVLVAYNSLQNDGCLFLHCDWHASHYIKVICDELFGYENFACEIHTMRSAKNAVNQTRRLFENTDSILMYWRSDLGRLIQIPTKPAEEGERWATLSAGGQGPPMMFFGNLIHPPKGRHFMWSQDHISEACEKGNIRLNSRGTPEYKIQRDRLPLGTLWNDIQAYAPKNPYPTAKTTVLMHRLVMMVTNPGDRVGDFFMGSGTLGLVCKMLGRDYYGSDISENAYLLAKSRIESENENDLHEC